MNTVLVTGANRGIGLELVRQYLEDKWTVFACCRQPEKANELNALARTYPSLSIFHLDVTNQDNINKLALELSSKPIDVLINNAGILGEKAGINDTLKDITADNLLQNFKINAIAPILMARAFVKNLEESKMKTLVNISSQMGSIELSHGNFYAYRMSKAALNMGIKSLSYEWAEKKIRVLLLHPGWVKTDMGGPKAPVYKQDSVKGLRAVISNKFQHFEGIFFDYQGKELPW